MKNAILAYLLVTLTYSSAYAAHAQLISEQSQFFKMNQATPAALRPVVNSLNDIIWNENEKGLTIKKDGVYTLIVNLQYGVKDNSKSDGNLYYWLEVDGKPMPKTLEFVTVAQGTKSNMVRFTTSMPLNFGSKVRFMFSSTSSDIGLVGFPSTKSNPLASSLSISVFKVGNIVTYL
jgi:hypothetical protein